ncbi:elongation factor G-like protein EF-G2 [Frankia sp. CNm7]|uniref:Elongation factor G-like protein EF-G2 n=1 Tax=Frankia nepalensis TaxID=1836974 RepID=A0A937RJ74_9ACTN|nr:elongation factor G-like protein EF-G2 [Frankia nepalensis]MBL7494761.1 elongation factor G-like protein EF-G2 [Frankia nepalensis]MBL7514018.1 elongation factor G-like protein EF-G2 [Frankia nepalensis]MBL7521822.1 elongation factor G-like protein EF-G2 [Frankia nepalensis]MBL7629950.1 elongation factor G-like protein EF-G2 [Frankia nepalensis]
MPSAAAEVRNVVLVGHTGAGKTALAEDLLSVAGAGGTGTGREQGRHPDGEHRSTRGISLTLSALHHRNMTINLLDTPGYPDFVGELRAGLRAADAALFVVSAVDGVDGATRALWAECAAVGMPRAVVVTRLDHPRADFASAVTACQDAFGAGVLPVFLPDGAVAGGDGARLVGLLTGRVVEYAGRDRRELDTSADLADGAFDEARGALIEGIIAESEDETLLDRYLGGEELDPKTLLDDAETAISRGSFHPVLPFAHPAGGGGLPVGSIELLDMMVDAFPSPAEHPLPPLTRCDGSDCPKMAADPDGPLLAEVVRTTTDPYVGRMSVVRVFSGTLRPDATVHVSGHGRAAVGHPDHDADEKVGGLSAPDGTTLRPLDACPAGGICVVTKLATAETGDTLSDRDDPRLLAPWTMPEPLLPIAIEARTKSDEDKLPTALSRLTAEDPTVMVRTETETSQLLLWCMGEAHADVLLERLASRYGVDVDRKEPRIALRETLRGPAHGLGRHVKQSGGHGQYAICHLEVEPLPAGSGLQFVDEVVGGAVPRSFIPSVEKGVLAQMTKGVVAGYPMVDIKVRLVDGKAHSVDSSDLAFQVAGGLALRDAAATAGVALLEPILEIAVLVPDEHVGAVMGDLSGRRGRVVGMEPVGRGDSGRTVIRAEVPELEMIRYAIDLRSVTQGTGTFTRSMARYEPMPEHLAAAVMKDRAS